MTDYLLAIDQGTTSSRAIVFDRQFDVVGVDQEEFTQYYPADGWVEHDAEEIWATTLATCRTALQNAGIEAHDLASIGITNQRETTIVWERATGRPIHNAIVWQDRRTADGCRALAEHAEVVTAKTGLLLDPYFSASKIAWILDHVDGARARAEAGELAFGTVDTWLLWQLTDGEVHATDASNASRTSLFDIHNQQWDQQLLDIFRVPAAVLPQVKDSADDYGQSQAEILGGAVPIGGVAGDQQAALIGQACVQPGMSKSTYGTGCFMVLNTGDQAVQSKYQLLTTVAYRIKGRTTYALEGSIFIAGAAVQWLRDEVQMVQHARDTEKLAKSISDTGGVYLVPAFTGLGAPYWEPEARGAIVGLTRDSGIAEITRAALEAVCYQTRDLLDAMQADGAAAPTALRVDGGMVNNQWLLQYLADTLQVTVERPEITETTALGAAYLAGLQQGWFSDLNALQAQWQVDRTCQPQMSASDSETLYAGWQAAVARVLPS